MHTLNSSFVLAYHGCDGAVADRLIAGADFRLSRNDYDWLGHGIYFWETNPRRGLEYARELALSKRGSHIKAPAVVGAVVELGLCLDLTTSAGLEQVKRAHEALARSVAKAGLPLPSNSKDFLRRNLDCAVIEQLHAIRARAGDPPIDSVKGAFIEGKPIYEGAGFFDRTHIQICIRNPDRIKGVFRVLPRFLV